MAPLATSDAHADVATVRAALTTLEQLSASGGLDALRGEECGEGLSECGPWVDASGRPLAPESLVLGLEEGEHRECSPQCTERWRALDAVRDARARLERASPEPRILEPFRRAAEALSPGAVSEPCSAPPDSLVRAQAAVLSHVYELSPTRTPTIHVRTAPRDLACLRVPTLHGRVRVRPLQEAPTGVPFFYIGPAEIYREAPGPSPHFGGAPTVVVELSSLFGHGGDGAAYQLALVAGVWRVEAVLSAWVG